MNFDAFLQTALLLVADRHGQQVRKDAIAFLRDLTLEDAVYVAMLADAADEALAFTRQLDDENVDSGELSAIVEHCGAAHAGPPCALPGGKVRGLARLHKPHVESTAETP